MNNLSYDLIFSEDYDDEVQICVTVAFCRAIADTDFYFVDVDPSSEELALLENGIAIITEASNGNADPCS